MKQVVHGKLKAYLRDTEGRTEAICFEGPEMDFLLEVTLGSQDCLGACEALSKQINELCETG